MRRNEGKMKKKVVLFVALTMLAASTALTGCRKEASKKATAEQQEKIKIETVRLAMSETKKLPVEGKGKAEYKSSKEEIVSVSKDGTVHGLKHGAATITVSTGEDTYKVPVKVKKRGMVYPAFSMMKGEHLDLQFSNADQVNGWTSADPSIATVSRTGKVQAKKVGHTTITGKNDTTVYTCDLTVTKKIKSVIYLTFDDGPNRYSTPKVLNILKKNHVRATFFELRPAGNDFDLTKRVIDEGHTLALHGFQHKYNIIYRSEHIYHQNLDKLRNMFFKKFGVWPTISRFPGGSSNTVSRYNPGIMTKLTKKLDGWGYHYFDWNVDSMDAGGAKTPADTFRNFKNGLVKGRGNVVLMHDFYKNDKTINALDKMIKYGKKHGYTFLPITASTTEVHHAVNN